MNHPRIELEQLKHIVDLHTQALSSVPTNHPMYGEMSRLLHSLQERVRTYDEFADNPYKTHTCLPKYDSDTKLGLGDYDIRH